MFKGIDRAHTNIPQELTAHGARPNGTTWFDRTNYFETFQATDENLEWALDLEADRMVNSFIAKKDLDSEMTVVRNEFELGRERPGEHPRASACSRRRTSGTTTAQSTIGARVGHRERADRAPAGVLPDATTSPTTPCSWSPASSTRRRRSRSINADLRRDPAADAHAAAILHRRADAGRRAQRDAAARRATCRRSPSAYHVPVRRPTRTRRPLGSAGRGHLGDTPSGRLYKALVETKKATSVVGLLHVAPRPGLRHAQRRGAPGPATSTTREKTHARDDRRRRWRQSADRRRRSSARAAKLAEEHRPDAEHRRPRRPRDERVDRRGRLAALLPEPRPHAPRSPLEDVQTRRRGVPEALQPHGRPSSCRRPSPTAPRFRRRPDGRRSSRTTRATPRRRRRGVRPLARQHRIAHEALDAAERPEDRAAPQEDARAAPSSPR